LSDTHPDRGVASGPVDDQRYVDGSEHEPLPPGDVVVVLPDVGGAVVVGGGGGLGGREHPNAETATSPAAIRTGPRRDRGTHPWALIGR
jgi:hypothetical protein